MKTSIKPAIPEKEIFTEDNQFPVCPWCGFEHNENYFEFDDGLFDCENCGREFEVKIVAHYTTIKTRYGSELSK